jgi:hypothetical protein
VGIGELAERIAWSGGSEAAICDINIPTLEEFSNCFLHYELYHEREGLTRVNLKGLLDEVMSRESNDESKEQSGDAGEFERITRRGRIPPVIRPRRFFSLSTA